jgi:hypothetical protein
VLRRIFGPKRDGVTGGWRKLHKEELHNLYCRRMCVGIGRKARKRPLGRPRRRWIDNIKMCLLEIGLNVVDWIGLAQDKYRWRAPVNVVMNFWVP